MNTVPRHLYIIGNGFDQHHDIESSYISFRLWMGIVYSRVLSDFEDAYGYENEDWWSNFENNLASFEVISYAHDIAYDNEPDLTSDHCDAMWDNAQVFVEETLKELFNNLRGCFHEWILQLKEPNEAKRINLQVEDSVFFTFNYTKTLEDMYKVDYSEVLHIHGCVNDDFVFGHGESEEELRADLEKPQEELKGLTEEEYNDWRNDNDDGPPLHEQLAINAAYAGVASQKKPVEDIMRRHEEFFNSLLSVNDVHVYGISFSKVDAPYLHRIAGMARRASWEFNDYKGKNIDDIEDFVRNERIADYRIFDLNNNLVKK